ncbi:cation diffusion facilitator family transporter [Phenylobacterium montanum]|uniref:Cation diffusion facilitator family transporter n=1 Tax=Phenylobacterium montanum TaxID=2823693 RepID=A0A975IWQ4_9CAUL|nr:cation diffusion facilitator family transporter [Caulobacter sp. S6]QUD89834.1 cation diffusion facilitator family transporter [Caulobacter sp. S6]
MRDSAAATTERHSTGSADVHRRERRLLLLSALMTVSLSCLGVGLGLLARSKALCLDGFYGLVDTIITGLSIAALRLIERGEDQRFQFGYWHLEPMLATANAAALTSVCLYAVADGLAGLLNPAPTANFGLSAIYAGASTLVGLAMQFYMRGSNRALRSQLLRVDAQSWLVGALLTLGLFVSFGLSWLVSSFGRPGWLAYIDPLVLIAAGLALLPTPLSTLRRSGVEFLGIAPADLDQQVRAIVAEVARRHDFARANTHVSRAGRLQFVEIVLVAASGERTVSFSLMDQIRAEIAEELASASPRFWLTVDFTADVRWL